MRAAERATSSVAKQQCSHEQAGRSCERVLRAAGRPVQGSTPAEEMFLDTRYIKIIHYWPTSLMKYLCSCAQCHLAMDVGLALVLPGSEDRL